MKERTYTVEWERVNYPEDGKLKCSSLTGKIAFARLMNAISNSGPITVISIKPDRPYHD